MPFPKILALTEGKMERLFLDLNFHYVEVVEIQNGRDWSIERLAEQVASKYRIKNMHADYVIAWLDRERRVEECSEIEGCILEALLAEGAPAARTVVCVPDRMTENVILADEELIRQQFELPEYVYPGEGCGGKHQLEGLYLQQGVYYKELTHGSALLKKVRLIRAADRSVAAAKLLALLDVDCWWKDRV